MSLQLHQVAQSLIQTDLECSQYVASVTSLGNLFHFDLHQTLLSILEVLQELISDVEEKEKKEH